MRVASFIPVMQPEKMDKFSANSFGHFEWIYGNLAERARERNSERERERDGCRTLAPLLVADAASHTGGDSGWCNSRSSMRIPYCAECVHRAPQSRSVSDSLSVALPLTLPPDSPHSQRCAPQRCAGKPQRLSRPGRA